MPRNSEDVLNQNLLKAIKQNFPKEVNLVSELMDTLSISREAVYRRLRGDMPFTLHEAAQIATKYNISLNDIANITLPENPTYELKPQRFYDLRDIDYKMLYEYRETLAFASKDTGSTQVFAANVFPQFPTNRYYLLAKYDAFRWVYQNQNISRVKPFHEIEFPEKLHELHKSIVDETMNIRDTTYIWSDRIFESVVKEIKYFSKIGLIRDEDVVKIKEELHVYIDFLERIVTRGRFDTGNKVQMYIMDLSSDAGYSYLETKNLHLSMIGTFAFNYVVSLKENALDIMKTRISSLLRISTLISESGQTARIDFFKNQRDIVETL